MSGRPRALQAVAVLVGAILLLQRAAECTRATNVSIPREVHHALAVEETRGGGGERARGRGEGGGGMEAAGTDRTMPRRGREGKLSCM